MTHTAGTRLGPYEIHSALGAGGMGEVYRARDTKLGRQVALKILPNAFTNDPDRVARFRREAHLLATLNHPHIAAIYGLEESDSTQFLVLELVEGDTLAERVARGPLPVHEALLVAKQITDALEAAHQQGVIHRDLKPANIKVREDGTVKVLDFGLAKALDHTTVGAGLQVGPPDVTNSPTLTTPAGTVAGMILGTAAYMSPEQARGKPVDKRADIWAFGCVLFEMLTGKRAFDGPEVSDTMAAILRDEPQWRALGVDVPASIEKLLRRCLHKDRKDRLADIADARLEIVDALAVPTSGASAALVDRRPAWWRFALTAVTAFVIGGFSVWVTTGNSQQGSTASVVRFAIHDTDHVIVSRQQGDMALSPDGRTLAFVGFGDSGPRLWLRQFDALEGRALPGTEGAVSPFWSPDGRWLAFVALGQIKKVAISGGPPQLVVAGTALGGGKSLAWGPDGTILYATNARGFWRGTASGATPTRVVAPVRDQVIESPEFLPDGRHFLFAVRSTDPAKAGTFVGSLEESARSRILTFPTAARYAAGRLLFVQDRTLYAQSFDPSHAKLAGDAVPLAADVAPAFSVSNNGVVAYLPLTASEQSDSSQLLWMDRGGRVTGQIDKADGAVRPTLAPDGRRLALNMRGDIVVLDLARSVLSRLTAGGGSATWLPDGQRLMFLRSVFRNGKDVIFETTGEGPGQETVVLEPDSTHAHPTDISADGRYLIYEGGEDGTDIWVKRLTGDRNTRAYLATPSFETQGTFSPDMRSIAYTSDSSGRFEVYVQSFPEPGPGIQVSSDGGTSARWRRDGKELFYLTLDGRMAAVQVRSAHPIEFDAPTFLFRFNPLERGTPSQSGSYDVTPDGQRFIVSAVVRRTDPSAQVVLNWPALVAAPKP